MKKILALILVIPVIFASLTLINNPQVRNHFSYSLCDQPTHYRVDTVDPKFNLSREEFLSDIEQASQIWSSNYNKALFVYDAKGDLSINLIYDERQSLTTQINQLEDQVQIEKQTIKPEIIKYQRLSAELKQKITNLNSQIESWNSKGGAPADEYKKLIQEQQDLQAEASSLNTMAKNLNISAETYNAQVNELNQTINSFNSTLEQRPEEGIFKGPENTIEIYFNISRNELIHTLAHELGHALGLGHINEPKAIMFPKTTKTLTVSNADIAALTRLCQRHSIFELLEKRISQLATWLVKEYK